MPHRRLAVVDLGSNSVRLVIYQGLSRNPSIIFNEKAVLALGRGLQSTGMLNEQGMAEALPVLERYALVAAAMHAQPMEILATAALRDAANGPVFANLVRRRIPGVSLHILSGGEEAALSALGLLCGIPEAEGVLGDMGGGSLELVALGGGGMGPSSMGNAASLPIGALRLADSSGGDMARARAVVEDALAPLAWLKDASGRDLYLVGGAWRALARIHIAQTGYPLHVVHHYTLGRDEARDLTGVITALPRRSLERIPGVPRRRIETLPYAAVVLRRLLRVTNARRVVFSANGLREGWYWNQLAEAQRREDPVIAAGRDLGLAYGRHPETPPALLRWTAPLFADDTPHDRRLREAACWASDIGAHEHPDYRAEQAFLRMLRQPGIGLDHHARAFLGLTLALRYEAEPAAPFTLPARTLLDVPTARRAERLGIALRLAYTLSAGTPDLLARTSLRVETSRLVLRLSDGGGVFAGESVVRRLERLAESLGLEPATEIAPAAEAAA
jgi:exopolyphosphatase / guanosine-5'-triphosphate,3'-diphosphate pyrophosphatase